MTFLQSEVAVQKAQFHTNAGVVQVIGFAECSYYNGSKAANIGECDYQLRVCSPGGDGYRLIAESNDVEELNQLFKEKVSINKNFMIFKVKGE